MIVSFDARKISSPFRRERSVILQGTIKPNLVQMADVLNTLVRQEKLKQNLQKCGNADHERGRL